MWKSIALAAGLALRLFGIQLTSWQRFTQKPWHLLHGYKKPAHLCHCVFNSRGKDQKKGEQPNKGLDGFSREGVGKATKYVKSTILFVAGVPFSCYDSMKRNRKHFWNFNFKTEKCITVLLEAHISTSPDRVLFFILIKNLTFSIRVKFSNGSVDSLM